MFNNLFTVPKQQQPTEQDMEQLYQSRIQEIQNSTEYLTVSGQAVKCIPVTETTFAIDTASDITAGQIVSYDRTAVVLARSSRVGQSVVELLPLPLLCSFWLQNGITHTESGHIARKFRQSNWVNVPCSVTDDRITLPAMYAPTSDDFIDVAGVRFTVSGISTNAAVSIATLTPLSY